MELSQKQIEALRAIAEEIGDLDLIEQIKRAGSERTSILEAAGVLYKSRNNYVPWFNRKPRKTRTPRQFNQSQFRPHVEDTAIRRSMRRILITSNYRRGAQ